MGNRPLTEIDPRLRQAVDANVAWYEDLCAMHGVGSRLDAGLWSSLVPPPPLHSDAVVVEPGVTADDVGRRLEGRDRAALKDSFAAIDAGDLGMDLLFSARWIHREAPRPTDGVSQWRTVSTRDELAAWTAGHDTAEVLIPSLLDRGHIAVLARHVDDRRTAGAVARLGSGVVDLSNVHALPGHAVDWEELAVAVGSLFPGRPQVGYERGDDLDAALAGGFDAVGELRVWAR